MRSVYLTLQLALAFPAYARPKAFTPEQLPKEVTQAVQVVAQSGENQLRSTLDGATEGYITAQAQLSTRQGFHVYKDRLSFWTEPDTALGNEEWKVETVEEPQTTSFLDPVTHSLKAGYTGESVFKLRLTLPHKLIKPLPAGHTLPFVVSFQACSNKLCLLPTAVKLDLVLGGAGAANVTTEEPGIIDRAVQKIRAALRASGDITAVTLLIVLGAGLITAFTPCVYPLYPVTLGIFARWSQNGGANPLSLSFSYCAGLTASYAVIGLISAASGVVFGSLTQTPPFLISVGVIILASALFFSGLFTFPMPSFLVRYFTQPDAEPVQGAALYGKAALMGAGLGVVASPCVGPVLVAILAWLGTSLAHGGSAAALKGLLLLSMFGAGMSLPFLVLGHFIIRMGKHPSLGRYTPKVKHLGTVLMVAASLFFLVPGVKLLIGSSAGATGVTAKYPVLSRDQWSKSQWTIIDFRADWCAACHELDRDTFANSEVSKLFENGSWDFVRIDMTSPDEATSHYASQLKVVSLPTVLITKPGGEPCATESLFGFEGPKAFLARLERAKQKCL